MDYLSLYTTLIERGKNRMPFPGSHCHRIVPGHKGGQYIPENICYLTRQEHRIIHWCRYKLWNNKADLIANVALGGINPGGYKLSEITKDKIRQKAIGRESWNKGKPNDNARQRMLLNNPMKDPAIAKKVSQSLKGSIPPSKITKTFIFICPTCGTPTEYRDTAVNRYRKYCHPCGLANKKGKPPWNKGLSNLTTTRST